MGSFEKRTRVTVQEYLEYLDSIDGRAEFYDGVIYDMAGSSVTHVRISTNLIGSLYGKLLGSNCEVFATDLKTEVEVERTYVLPDVSIICGSPEISIIRDDIVRNPTVIFEVLSDSTADFDRKKKFDKSKLLESLREYVLVEQFEPRVDVYFLNDVGKWEYTTYINLNEVVKLNAIQQELPMSAIYRNVAFDFED